LCDDALRQRRKRMSFAGLNFHVPLNGLSAASRETDTVSITYPQETHFLPPEIWDSSQSGRIERLISIGAKLPI
jgi:hypothetical protein